jgi:hypothetical protein
MVAPYMYSEVGAKEELEDMEDMEEVGGKVEMVVS